jgi:hypothetical protein
MVISPQSCFVNREFRKVLAFGKAAKQKHFIHKIRQGVLLWAALALSVNLSSLIFSVSGAYRLRGATTLSTADSPYNA